MLLKTLAASMLGSTLTGRGVIRADEGTFRASESTIKASEGTICSGKICLHYLVL